MDAEAKRLFVVHAKRVERANEGDRSDEDCHWQRERGDRQSGTQAIAP
jgi:hypothetical protein